MLDQAADLEDRLPAGDRTGRAVLRRHRPGCCRHRGSPSRSGRRSPGPGRPRCSGGTSVRQTSWAQRAARVEGAAGRDVQQVGRQALDRVQLPALLVQPRDRVEQALGVRVGGRPVDLVDGRGLHDPARVHHRDLVGDVGDHAEVVGDQDQAHVVLALQLREQVHDLGLHGDVERGGRLVGDDQVGLQGHRHGDHDALAHTAGELVRVVADPLARRPGCGPAPSARSPWPGPSLRDMPAVHGEHLAELVADAEHGVEGGQRVLEDHRHLRAADLAPLLVAAA